MTQDKSREPIELGKITYHLDKGVVIVVQVIEFPNQNMASNSLYITMQKDGIDLDASFSGLQTAFNHAKKSFGCSEKFIDSVTEVGK